MALITGILHFQKHGIYGHFLDTCPRIMVILGSHFMGHLVAFYNTKPRTNPFPELTILGLIFRKTIGISYEGNDRKRTKIRQISTECKQLRARRARTKLCTFCEQTQLSDALLAIDDVCLAHARIDAVCSKRNRFQKLYTWKITHHKSWSRAIFAL